MTFLYDLLELYEFSNTLVGTSTHHMTEPIKYLRKTMQVMQEDHQCAIRENQMCLSQKELHGGATMDELSFPSQWIAWLLLFFRATGHLELCTLQYRLDTSAFAVNLYHWLLSSISVHGEEGSYPLDFSLPQKGVLGMAHIESSTHCLGKATRCRLYKSEKLH